MIEIRQIKSSLFFEQEISRCFKKLKKKSVVCLAPSIDYSNLEKEHYEFEDEEYMANNRYRSFAVPR